MTCRVGGFALFLLLAGPGFLEGQGELPPPSRHPGESLEVSLVTAGPGDLVWERFGHNALLFQDRDSGTEVAYHWGVFDFQQVDFVPRLIRGTMLYSMGPSDFGASVAGYRRDGRRVWVQELALTPPQRWALLALVEENYLPQNRDYRYDYYRDNCSTRVRDALDHVLGGRIVRRFASDTTGTTYRWHTRRVLQAMPPYYLGIQLVLGPNADHPITVWEEMFLPLSLRDGLREIRVPDGDGGEVPLVRREELVADSGRPPPPSSPPFALPLFLLAGVIWGGAMLQAAGSRGEVGPGRRLIVALLAGGWATAAGMAGTLLLGAWAFTDHFFWYENYNLFQMNPLFLALPPAFLVYLIRGQMPRWGARLATVLAGISLLGLAVELLPGLGQRNGEILMFTLPVNLALWGCALRLRRDAPSAASGGGGGGSPPS